MYPSDKTDDGYEQFVIFKYLLNNRLILKIIINLNLVDGNRIHYITVARFSVDLCFLNTDAFVHYKYCCEENRYVEECAGSIPASGSWNVDEVKNLGRYDKSLQIDIK